MTIKIKMRIYKSEFKPLLIHFAQSLNYFAKHKCRILCNLEKYIIPCIMHLHTFPGMFQGLSIKTLTNEMLFLDRDLHWEQTDQTLEGKMKCSQINNLPIECRQVR